MKADNVHLPGAYLQPLIAHFDDEGLCVDHLLATVGLTREDVTHAGTAIPVSVFSQLAAAVKEQQEMPLCLLGLKLGRYLRTTAHGHLGFAVMTAPTIEKGLELAIRLIPTRTEGLGLHLDLADDRAFLRIEEYVDFGHARELVISALLVGVWQNGEALTGHRLTGTAEVSFPAPPGVNGATISPDGEVLFDQPASGLRFDRDYLALPFSMSDPVAHELALEQCEAELARLTPSDRFVTAVRGALRAPGGGFRSQPEVARVLATSPRTLKRRLSEAETSFSDLLDEQRRVLAARLLRADKNVDQVADALGYANAANFSRAFRRWHGQSPGQWRALQG